VDEAVRARIPADVDTPDRILLGLTTRQAAILAAAAVPGYLAWRSLDGLVPPEVLLAALTPFGVIVTVIALGRRDGLSLDRWFTAALVFVRAPRRLASAATRTSLPVWAPTTGSSGRTRRGQANVAPFAPLRLPARGITADGIVETGDRSLALVAASTVNIDLRTAAEQAAMIGGFARWLNALTGPVQIVVSAQRVDLAAHAVRIAEHARSVTDPQQGAEDALEVLDVLTQAAARHADWLLDLAQECDPLARTVTVVHTAPGPGGGAEAARRAARTASALTALGASTVALDGATVTTALAAATDRYQAVDPTWPRTPPSGVVTGIVPLDPPNGLANQLGNQVGSQPITGHQADRVRLADRAGRANGGVAQVVGPSAVEVMPSCLRVGDGWAATVAVTGYPAEVGAAWLEPVLAWPGRLDAALHVEPISSAAAAGQLRRQRARLESTRRLDADKGRLGDPLVDAAADDAADLADRLARGEARLFRVGIYFTVHAPTRAGVLEAVADVRALAASVLLDTQPVTWRQLQGWTSTLPLGTDSVRMTRVFDTAALAMAFPLASSDLPAPLPGQRAAAGGVLYGVNGASQGVVWWNRWDCDNHNSVVLARSGAGKSYFVKLEVLRSLYDGVHAAIIDPEDEYLRLAEAVGGATIQLGAPGIRLNPLDLPAGDTRPDTLTRRILFLHTLVAVLLGHQPPPTERAALDRAVIAAYAGAGITNDPDTWTRPAPLLRDVVDALAADGGTGDPHAGDGPGAQLAARLWPWVKGSFRDLFDGPTTYRPRGRLVVWSTRQLPEELRAAGMLLALDAVWRDVDNPTGERAGAVPPRRLVVVDEAWTLLRDGEGARFLYKLAKAARKRRAGLTVVTQDAPDLLGSDLGQAVISNSATQILLRQAPQAIDLIADTFHLTAGEARLLLTAPRGQALLLSGQHRVTFQIVADPGEHHLATGVNDLPTDPA
jgi:hypothetical protein